jgi:hypothetical protein
MRVTLLFGFCGLALLSACSDSALPQAAPGADRDAHGCIPSAGYSWCARTKQCQRPWELAKKYSLENTQQTFDSFCSAVPDSA